MFSYPRLLSLLLILAAIAVSSVLYLEKRWQEHHAAGPLTTYKEITIASGSGLNRISQDLYHQGIIRDNLSFRIIARLNGLGGQIKAGSYRFPQHISADQVLKMLVNGKTRLYSITIPEGLTSQQILARILNTKALGGKIPTSLLEASLMPETYHFEKNMPRKELIKLMQQKWQAAIQPLWQARDDDYPLQTLEEVLILASIVEKEAVRNAEMPTIAGIFMNRLRKKMKLQSDPTVIYAVSAGLGKMDRRLTRKDWKFPHDHNTYYRNGLPPTAIAHPSLDAVKATLNPEQNDYIFFVADGKGGHRFSVTLKEHNANVAKLNKLRKEVRKKKS